MKNRKQPDRWESMMLAVILAVAGTLFLLDKLGTLMRHGSVTVLSLAHAAPLFLAVMAVSLLVAEQASPAAGSQEQGWKEGRHERQ